MIGTLLALLPWALDAALVVYGLYLLVRRYLRGEGQ